MLPNSSRSQKDIDLLTTEVSHLLDISPDPSILVSNNDLGVMAANAAMAELTGYTRKELLKIDLDLILPDIQSIRTDDSLNLELHSLQGCRLDLINRRKQKTESTIQAKALGKDRRYTVYRITTLPRNLKNKGLADHEVFQLDGILALVQIFYQSTLEKALDIILQVGKDILDAESLGIYKIDSNHPQLKAVLLDNPSDFLPDTISTTDFFSHYKDSHFSPPFKPPLSPLMERAAEKGSSFVISSPLNDDNSISGLIVAMGSEKSPAPDKKAALAGMKLLVAATEGVFNNFILKSNLNDLNRVKKEIVAMEKNVSLAERAYKIADDRYKEGEGSELEVKDADISLSDARVNYTRAIHDYLVSKASLYNLVGRIDKEYYSFVEKHISELE